MRVEAEIWMVSAEAAPLAKAGGLGDVLRALPAALARSGLALRRLLPAYAGVPRDGFEREQGVLPVPLGEAEVPVRFLSRFEPDGVRTTLVECEELFGREGIYGPPGGEYADNARRFALFCRAICERARRAAEPPAILHAHDWHAALVGLFVRFAAPWRRAPRTVLTIHNLGYQGRFGADALRWLSLGDALRDLLFRPDGIEFYGDVNFLKAGILYSDRITTVSPTYAREIQTPERGFGLDGAIRQRSGDLVGILNGADYDVWDPATDPHLPARASAATASGSPLAWRKAAAQALRSRLSLVPGDAPVLGVVGRLAHQKGIDVLAAAAPALLEDGALLAVLGAGDPCVERDLQALRLRHGGRLGLHVGYDETLSHLIVAGCDLILVPSRYEPCGLVQMHALRYGALPVVHRTGGLADTVRDVNEHPGRGTGFVFGGLVPDNLVAAVRRALALRASDPKEWRATQRRAMAEEFSWDRAAASYAALYAALLR